METSRVNCFEWEHQQWAHSKLACRDGKLKLQGKVWKLKLQQHCCNYNLSSHYKATLGTSVFIFLLLLQKKVYGAGESGVFESFWMNFPLDFEVTIQIMWIGRSLNEIKVINVFWCFLTFPVLLFNWKKLFFIIWIHLPSNQISSNPCHLTTKPTLITETF